MALEIVKSDDYIEYFLFPQLNAPSDELEVEENILKEVLVKVNDIAKEYCDTYIWHKDSYNFKVKNRNSHLLIETSENEEEPLPPHLYGISHVGDNISDEWFIVSLLFKLSKNIPGLIIRTADSDGEFMLIEAADFLPQWANPETCEQRVYIFEGRILLVQNSPSNTTTLLPVTEAVNKIRANARIYGVSKNVENCVIERIKDFPQNMEDNFHRQTVFVPLGVAAVLRNNPQVIAPAVQAFCNRDQIDMKVCRAMRYFPPENRVYTSIKFTKCLYAMVMHNNYLPDRRTGWNLPSSNSPHFTAHSLGVKLACGFEILASQAKTACENIEEDRDWLKYFESLKKRNYFQDLIEGSKGYKSLLETAKDYYKDHRDTMKITPKIGDEIVKQLKTMDYSYEDFKKLEPSLPDSDSDSWLNIAQGDLDEMLQKRYGIKNLLSQDANANAGNLTEMLTEFLERKSEYDGVEVDVNENFSALPPTLEARINYRENGQISDSSVHLAGGNISNNRIDFDPDGFSMQVQNLLDLVIPEDKWDSNSDMSDYENDDDLLAKNIDEFTSKSHGRKHKKGPKNEVDKYMDQMDRELANTTIGKSFEMKRNQETNNLACGEDEFDDFEDFTPVDIDANAIKNMMESYKLQGASAGPTSNLLSSMLNKNDGTKKKQTDV